MRVGFSRQDAVALHNITACLNSSCSTISAVHILQLWQMHFVFAHGMSLRVAVCAVRFELCVKGSDKVVVSSSEEGDEFSVSQDSHVCRALPIAAKAMKKGERAQLVIKPACAPPGLVYKLRASWMAAHRLLAMQVLYCMCHLGSPGLQASIVMLAIEQCKQTGTSGCIAQPVCDGCRWLWR